jgi:putative cell wall-binding protein
LRNRLAASALAAATLAATLFAGPVPARAAGEKVAIIVGPVGGGSLQSYFLSSADQLADVASAAGATVATAYSPNATWGNVRAAVNGANVVVYLGHGNGFPNPYSSTQHKDRYNGWGLNRTTTNGHGDDWQSTLVYCGEKALLGTLTSTDGAPQRQYCSGGPITPAPGFVMVYAGAHYTPGFGECYVSTCSVATFDEARARVANYSRPILQLGGSAYYATVHQSGAREIVRQVLTQPGKSAGQIFRDSPGYSASDLVVVNHPDVAGAETWLQRTVVSGMHFNKPDYWYAFAGNPSTPPGGLNSSLEVVRFAGSDRYATAVQVSSGNFSPGVPVAYVATGLHFPDALAGGVPAARRGGPVLLVKPDEVPAATAAELDRLNPAEIVVLGGTGVVSNAVANAVAGYATTGSVRRLAGADRYGTAAAISADTFSPGVPVAFIATGLHFPDALAGVPAAAKLGGPILLVSATGVPAATAAELQRLAPGRIVILGGPAVVSDGLAAQLDAFTSGAVQRYWGADRFATAVQISANTWSSATTVYIATGMSFPDALAGAPVAGMNDSPLLLVNGTSLPTSVRDELLRLGPDRVVVLGGNGVVSPSVVYQMQALFPAP